MTVRSDRRKNPRLSQSLQARARLPHKYAELAGITHNLSQSRAFIDNPSWTDFQVDDQMEIIFFFQPEFTGQKDTLFLKDLITVEGVDGDR